MPAGTNWGRKAIRKMPTLGLDPVHSRPCQKAWRTEGPALPAARPAGGGPAGGSPVGCAGTVTVAWGDGAGASAPARPVARRRASTAQPSSTTAPAQRKAAKSPGLAARSAASPAAPSPAWTAPAVIMPSAAAVATRREPCSTRLVIMTRSGPGVMITTRELIRKAAVLIAAPRWKAGVPRPGRPRSPAGSVRRPGGRGSRIRS